MAERGPVLLSPDRGRRRAAARPPVESLEARRLLSAPEMLQDIAPGDASSGGSPFGPSGYAPTVYAPVRVHDRLVFFAGGEDRASALWATDGTPAGTRKLVDLAPDVGSVVSALVPFKGDAWFFASASDTGDYQLFRTDGTAAGTQAVTTVRYDGERLTRPEPNYPRPEVMGDAIYFAGGTAGAGARGLMKTDGTAAGTALVKEFPFARVDDLTAVGDTLFFTQGEDNRTNFLWKSDGTEAGTVQVKSFGVTPQDGHEATDLLDVNGTLFLRARSPVGNLAQLWKSDGTEAGTLLVKQFAYGLNRFPPVDLTLVNLNGTVVFAAPLPDAPGGPQLWKSDGTPDGTVMVVDTNPSGSAEFDSLRAVGGVAYFRAKAPDSGWELWRSDATPDGTRLVADLTPGPLGGQLIVWPQVEGTGRAYFTNSSPDYGYELWSTDGTAAGTRRESDVNPGAASSMPTFPTRVGDVLFVRADDGVHGREPWAVPAPVSGAAAVVGRHVFEGAALAAEKSALLPGGSASFANVTAYGRGINGLAVDVAALPAGAALTPDDFVFRTGASADTTGWVPAPAPLAVEIHRGEGQGGSDRVTLAFADGAVVNGWLAVTLKSGAATGLAAPDTFYFGNLVGETGNGATAMTVNAVDLGLVRSKQLGTDPADLARFDFNKDGRINAVDLGLCRTNQLRSLPSFNAPPSPTPVAPGLLADDDALLA